MSAAKAHILLCIKNLMAKRYWSVPLKNTHIVKARADAIFSGKVYTVYFTRSHHICPGKTLGVPSNKESTSLGFFFFSLSHSLPHYDYYYYNYTSPLLQEIKTAPVFSERSSAIAGKQK